MSVYGGFTTRKVENTYNMAVFNLISLLQYRVHQLVQKTEDDHEKQFKKLLARQYTYLYKMDTEKRLLPKFSYAMKELAKCLGIFEQTASELRTVEHPLAPKARDHLSPSQSCAKSRRERSYSRNSAQKSDRSRSQSRTRSYQMKIQS